MSACVHVCVYLKCVMDILTVGIGWNDAVFTREILILFII